jgi:hypothetical protein
VLDIVTILNLEAYTVQMRAFARDSKRLASVSSDDTAKALLPKLENFTVHETIRPFVEKPPLASQVPL